MTPPPFTLHRGSRPLLVSVPHAGTYVPAALTARLTDAARALPDTDWHVDRLYAFARDIGASMLVATHSRYVIDLNRPPDDHNLYPGRDTTGLCPVDTFDRAPVYRNAPPSPAEIAARIDTVHRPYHDALAAELARLHERHGTVALWDAHSIRSVVPRFFDGVLPDFNIGTVGATSAAAGLVAQVAAVAAQADGFTTVVDGRFKGGHITRRYGDPSRGIHAIQLELAQRTYMDESPPYAWRAERAARVAPPIAAMLDAALVFAGGSHG
ncbi:MAG TPA: N-formylglutamate deformylase [Casimicrobiaceae bacterium]|jgi:N-formylglutamate deformylase|nr:N-formylglutamate deformylase [Casimicrobiaceae bacterium]